MTLLKIIMKFYPRAFALVASLLFGVANAHAAGEGGGVQRMTVFHCGEAVTSDISFWSPGVDVGKAREFSANCYLIRHAKGLMLWDSGMQDSIAALPNGRVTAGGRITARVSKPLQAQLRALGMAPTDITHLAFSHTHEDHVGNANLFTAATLYMQEAEYDAAFGPDAATKFKFNPALYEKLRANPVVKLHGDYDVFGDGEVVILSTPGHTPGHQSLLVRLPKRGKVLLSGDVVHFKENWINRRVPAGNFSREQSLASMEKIAAVLKREHAELWINHDKAQSATVPHAPDFVE